MGGTPKLRMVMALSGCRLCMRCNVPLFFTTQNHQEQYDVLECSYTLTVNLSLKIWMMLPIIPEGMGMFLCAQGMCSMTGILTGEKYSSLNLPFSASVHANPSSLILSTCFKSLSSSSQRKLSALRVSSLTRSRVRHSPGVKSGGFVRSGGSERRGSIGM